MAGNLKSLTGIRGIAALYVVLYHFTQAKISFLDNGYIAVDLFFILSGFIMHMVYKDKFSNEIDLNYTLRYLYHRFARIYPLFVFILAFSLYQYFKNGTTIPADIITKNIFMLHGLFGGTIVGASWSVSIEVLAYVLFPFICFMINRNSSLAALTLILSFFLLNTLPALNNNHSNGLLDIYTGYQSVLRGLCGFLIGCCILKISSCFTAGFLRMFGASDIAFLMIITALCHKGFDMALVILFSAYIALLYHGSSITKWLLESKPIYFLGEISFSLYLTHLLFQRVYGNEINNLAKHLFPDIEFANIYFMLAFTIALSIITYLTIEVPFRKSLRKLEYKLFR